MSRRLSLRATRMLLAAMRVLARLPYPVLRVLGNGVGALLYRLVAPRRRVARINLRLCMPELDDAQREAIVRAHFRYYSRSFFDRFVFWYGSPERIRRLARDTEIAPADVSRVKKMLGI